MNRNFSVLIPVYWKEKSQFLEDAIKSILNQTLRPTEIVLVCDGALTESLDEVIKRYDHQLRIVRYKENRGLGKVLADGVKECSYDIIIRADSDDVSVPERFEKIIETFDTDDTLGIVGSNIIEYDEDLKSHGKHKKVPQNREDIIAYSKSRNPFNHMAVAFKKQAVIQAGNYEDMPGFEDYFLWCKMLQAKTNCCNIQQTLVMARAGKSMVGRRGGIGYVKNIYTFGRSLYRIKYISLLSYLRFVISRTAIGILPTDIRALFYSIFLRKNDNEFTNH